MTGWDWFHHHPVVYRWLPLGAWMGLIFLLSAQPDLPHPEAAWADIFLSSGAHILEYGILAILWARVLGVRRRSWIVALLLTGLYAVSDELHQAFVPGRHPDLMDLACDGLGAASGLGLWTWLKRCNRG